MKKIFHYVRDIDKWFVAEIPNVWARIFLFKFENFRSATKEELINLPKKI